MSAVIPEELFPFLDWLKYAMSTVMPRQNLHGYSEVKIIYVEVETTMRINNQFKISLLTLALLSTTPFVSGCSSRHTSVSTTEVREEPSSRSELDRGERVEVTKTTEVKESDSHHGFFGILGDIIALPFRAIAAIL